MYIKLWTLWPIEWNKKALNVYSNIFLETNLKNMSHCVMWYNCNGNGSIVILQCNPGFESAFDLIYLDKVMVPFLDVTGKNLTPLCTELVNIVIRVKTLFFTNWINLQDNNWEKEYVDKGFIWHKNRQYSQNLITTPICYENFINTIII